MLGHGDEQNQLLPKKVEAFAGRRVIAVSAGAVHSLASTADGAVWSCGCGLCGRLGHGNQQNQLLPKKIEAFLARRVAAVSAGAVHSLAFTATGAVFAWGKGEYGCLGHGEDLSNQQLPKEIEGGRRRGDEKREMASSRTSGCFCEKIELQGAGAPTVGTTVWRR